MMDAMLPLWHFLLDDLSGTHRMESEQILSYHDSWSSEANSAHQVLCVSSRVQSISKRVSATCRWCYGAAMTVLRAEHLKLMS
jgi:hypothetical protein